MQTIQYANDVNKMATLTTFSQSHYFDDFWAHFNSRNAVQVKIKFKSSWGLSHYFEGWEMKSCCLEWPSAFVLGNKSPSRGSRTGPLPISLCFNYPACLQQGNEVGVTAGVKRQPVTAASPLGLSFPWRRSVDWQGQGGGKAGPTAEWGLHVRPLIFSAWTTSRHMFQSLEHEKGHSQELHLKGR